MWREFDPVSPDPGYFQFDWLSARHPDLYDAFALSSVGLIEEMCRIIDFAGSVVADIGAGTGRSTIGLARQACQVIAIDAFPSVCEYGACRAEEQGLRNVNYVVADRGRVPLADDSVDSCVASWAKHSTAERRIGSPGRADISSSAKESGQHGDELGPILGEDFPDLIANTTATPSSASVTVTFDDVVLPDARFLDNEVHYHEFSYVSDYGDADEAAAILGRMFGPRAGAYMRAHRQSTVTTRLGIYYGRIAK